MGFRTHWVRGITVRIREYRMIERHDDKREKTDRTGKQREEQKQDNKT